MNEYLFIKKISLTDGDILDILCACIEGGSNYWAQIQNCGKEWDDVVKEIPDGTIEDHILALWHKDLPLVILDIEEDEYHNISFEDFIRAIQTVIDDGTWDGDDVAEIDSVEGDCIMQYATFGEIIYG